MDWSNEEDLIGSTKIIGELTTEYAHKGYSYLDVMNVFVEKANESDSLHQIKNKVEKQLIEEDVKRWWV